MDMKMTDESKLKELRYQANIRAEVEAPVILDRYDKVEQRAYVRTLGKIDITASSLEQLKAKLHAHVDLLE
jgi:hypothetical protein